MAKLVLKTATSRLEVEIGTELHTQGAYINCYAGGSDTTQLTSVYEADKGFIILEALPRVVSQWGNNSYSTSLTARDSSVEKQEKIFQQFDELINKSSEKGDDKNALFVNWVRKQILDYYFKYSSKNARFEVSAYAHSEKIKVLGVVVDTKTGNIEMDFTFRLLKLIAPEENTLITTFLETAVVNNEQLSYEYLQSYLSVRGGGAMPDIHNIEIDFKVYQACVAFSAEVVSLTHQSSGTGAERQPFTSDVSHYQ